MNFVYVMFVLPTNNNVLMCDLVLMLINSFLQLQRVKHEIFNTFIL